MIFQKGETVICSITVKDSDDSLKNVATSMNIAIDQIGPQYSNQVSSTSMTNDGTGKYHHDCATSSMTVGIYKVIYTATDETRITIVTDTFKLE